MVALSQSLPPRPARHAPRSGYRNVYEEVSALGPTYRVRVCKRVNLPGRFPSETDAARFLVGWLRDFYAAHVGGRYDADRAVRAVTEQARRNYRYVRRVPGAGRFAAVVYVLGEPQLVTSDVSDATLPPERWGRRGDRTWPTRAAAGAAIDLWLKRFRASFGLYERYAGLWLWR